MKTRGHIIFMGVFMLVSAVVVHAQPTADNPYVVAVLDFETKGKDVTTLGENTPDLLSAFLSADENLQLVERAEIKKIIEEMALGKTGIVKPDEAAKIGHMTGAKFLITGRVFVVGDKLYVTSKVMSAETSKVKAVVAKAPIAGELDEIVQELAAKVSDLLAANGAAMLPKVESKEDVIVALKEKLKGKTLPAFAVLIPESHVGQPIPDPAAQTEIMYLLKKAGDATVIDTQNADLNNWVKQFLKEAGQKMPAKLQKADVVIVGEAFSEFAGTTGKLISVKARLEVKAIDVKTDRILAIERVTTTAVDLAENIAAKSALQECGWKAGAKLIPAAVDKYLKLKAGGKGDK